MSLRTVPPHPGSILRHQVVNRLKIRQADFARAMGITTVRLNQILNGRAPITPGMALRIARVTNTAPEYWLGLQGKFDLHVAKKRLAVTLAALEPFDFDPPRGDRNPMGSFL